LGKESAREGVVELRGPASFQVRGGRRAGFDLARGRLLAVLPSLKSRFNVRARGLVASVRGTDFYVDLAGRNDLYLCVCDGTVEVNGELLRLRDMRLKDVFIHSALSMLGSETGPEEKNTNFRYKVVFVCIALCGVIIATFFIAAYGRMLLR
jgi:hypothetical protein